MFNEVIDEMIWDEKNGIPVIEEKLLVFREKRDELYSNVIRYKHLKLSSDSFVNHGIIPSKHTCDGRNVNPSIAISNLPENAKSIAVVVDAPNHVNGNCCHWVIWNLPITDRIEENEHRGLPGRNDFGFYKYNGPCPTTGTHRYLFKVYALDYVLNIPACSDKIQLEKAMKNHVVGFSFLVGKYHMRL
jgi:Raf kinase inhibitor-like YbhB/YbcL family protein